MSGAAGQAATDERLLSLDVLRGVAVGGILLANLPAFALPAAAYFSPLAWGGTSSADLAAWTVNFILVEGKLRALFSLVFGASLLLVLDRARLAGQQPERVHLARMAALFALGMAHLYLVWWGDILSHYALVGTIALLFSSGSARSLLRWSLMAAAAAMLLHGLTFLALLDAASRDTPQAVATWNAFATTFGVPPRGRLLAEIAALGGSWSDGLRWRLAHAPGPLALLRFTGLETLAAMLLGMAGLRSGFLTGEWGAARYRRLAAITLAVALPAYALLAAMVIAWHFDQRAVYLAAMLTPQPLRLIAAAGYAALILSLVCPGGMLTMRLAAAGRLALSNYLATSLIASAIFYGWGLGWFARLGRAEFYLLAPPLWLAMLLWSKPWLGRFRLGPFEWLWRSIARLAPQPLRR